LCSTTSDKTDFTIPVLCFEMYALSNQPNGMSQASLEPHFFNLLVGNFIYEAQGAERTGRTIALLSGRHELLPQASR
jgi:hypothetical protein